MAGTHLTPPLRRLAIFLVAFALVAAISPGLAIAAANGAPKPVLDVITTAENTPINGNVLDNDINLGSGTLTVTGFVALAPSIGTLTIEADGDFVFTPADHWTGTTSTTYEVSNDSHSHDGDIQITVTPINEAPDAVNDTATVDEDTPTDVTAQLLVNDTDPDGDTLVVTAASNPTGGSVDVTSNVVTFTPASEDCGAAIGSFDYDISDGNGGTDSASVTVNVSCTNDAPDAVADNAPATEDTPATIDPADLLTNDTDADIGDTLVVTAVSSPSDGSVVLDSGSITFTPDADFCGAAGFDYDISDGNGGTDSASVTVNVSCTNDAPDAVADNAPATEDTPATIDPADLLTNDTDADTGDTLVVTAVSSPSDGSVVLDSGSITFTPDADLLRGRRLRLRHQRRQRRHRQRERDGQRQLHQRCTRSPSTTLPRPPRTRRRRSIRPTS